MSITTESGLGTKDDPEDEDSLLTHENQSDVARGITLISDLVSEVSSIDDGELIQKMEESGISHEDAQTALTKAFESKIITKEGGPGSGPTKNLPEQTAMSNINPDYNAFSKDPDPLQDPSMAPMVDSESLARETHQVEDYFDIDEYEAKCRLCGEIEYFTDDSPSEQPSLEDHLERVHGKDFNHDIGGYEAKAKEEGMGSVSGPPAGTEPTVREEKDNTFVLPADSNETLVEEDVADRELDQEELGEVDDSEGEGHGDDELGDDPSKHYDDDGNEITIAEDGSEEIINENDVMMLNENYIQLGDQLYRPRYTSEEAYSDDLIFENKFFTSEGVGNCQFCKGAGKITVERLGLKECPDCDGTGDVQGNPMAQVDPTMQPIGDVPEVPQPEIPEQTPQEPKKPNIGESSGSMTFDVPDGGTYEFRVNGKTELTIGEAKLKAGYVKCDHCDQQFSSVQWALDHMKEAHPNASESKKKATEKEFKNTKDDGHRHIRNTQGNTYKTFCAKCGTNVNLLPDDQVDTVSMTIDEIFDMNGWNYPNLQNAFSESKKKSTESKSCKPCRKTMAREANISKFKRFIDIKLEVLQKKAKAGESVSLMYGLPTVERQGRKIKGTLAYAGVSLNDRIYLPEELAKGDGLTLPLLLNHSSIAGAEDELDRLDDEMLDALYNEEDYEIGEVTLTWDPAKLTLFYTGVVENEFFQKEIDDMDMAVSLGIYYDSDSPRICDVNCYTLIKGAEFREVSLVYHAGFPIATIEAVEAQLKKRALKSIEKEEKLSNIIDRINKKNEPEGGWKEEDKVEEAEAQEEQDDLARGGSVDVEEIQDEGPAPTIDLNDEWEGQTIVTEMFTPDNFSVRGVMGMTISNANGVERYTFDPALNYTDNTIHFDTYNTGATIYGETLQPKMGTPDELTKEIESKPDIVVEDADKDAFESVKKKEKVKKRG